MSAPATPALPDDGALARGLASVLGVGGDGDGLVLARRANAYASSFPSEFVTCRLPAGRVEVLCKYAGPGDGDRGHGHRRGPAYEAQVYRDVLAHLPVPAPAAHGFHSTGGGTGWLVMERLDGATVADEAPDAPAALVRAAEWLARFHTGAERLLAAGGAPGLTVYDAGYYRRWARRTAALAGDWHARLPWLEALCARLADLAPTLAALPPTVVHGEFTPHNVLVRGDEVLPVDWESAAVAFGEIDLVALVDKWPPDVARSCERAYARTRRPAGDPAGFARRLDLARVYWDLRWLGDRPEWTRLEKIGARYAHLREAAARLRVTAE